MLLSLIRDEIMVKKDELTEVQKELVKQLNIILKDAAKQCSKLINVYRQNEEKKLDQTIAAIVDGTDRKIAYDGLQTPEEVLYFLKFILEPQKLLYDSTAYDIMDEARENITYENKFEYAYSKYITTFNFDPYSPESCTKPYDDGNNEDIESHKKYVIEYEAKILNKSGDQDYIDAVAN